MSNPFFDHPILNSPYDCPQRHWELDSDGQPTQQVLESRRRAEFVTPIPKPKKRKKAQAQGEIGVHGGNNGDLYFKVKLKPNTLFRASGSDLYMDLALTP